jgi:UDP-N-acetylglucosamine 4,6-dehydratase/5-epimerase
MKKVLITGGTGTIGSAFIKEYYDKYQFFSISRGEEQIAELNYKYPKVKTLIRDICDLDQLINTFESIKPDIVIHTAALKHVNLAEINPSKAVEINLNGSLNVVKASVRAKVPLTVGISTDKACSPESVYGYTKKMMEQIFTEYHNLETKFVCTRFANVAGSKGSVIPFFKSLLEKKSPLKLTSVDMNRLMFSSKDAVHLIHNAIDYSNKFKESFVLSEKMKSVNMLKLAKVMSVSNNTPIKVIGLRPGEKLNETLISTKEIPYTKVINNLIFLFKEKQKKENNLDKSFSSLNSPFMSNKEIETLLKQ